MPASIEHTHHFTDAYKDMVFWTWYNSNKVSVVALYNMIPGCEPHMDRPSRPALQRWMQDFRIRAEELDNAAMDEMKAKAVKAKVEMLERHAQIASKMQEIGFEVLDENKDNIGTAAAVRLIVEGVRIERESVGIPAMLDKLSVMDDQKLLDTINELVTKTPVEIEALEDG